MSKGIAPNVGKRALQGKYATHIQNDPKKDQASAGKAANLEGYDLACDGGGVARRSVMTAPLVETGEDRQMGGGDDRLIGVVQLRTRIWRGDGLEEQSDKVRRAHVCLLVPNAIQPRGAVDTLCVSV